VRCEADAPSSTVNGLTCGGENPSIVRAMPRSSLLHSVLLGCLLPLSAAEHGDGSVSLSGELRQWHAVTLTVDGPFAKERDTEPNPFTDIALTVRFSHESGDPSYHVPGYFAADGNAAETGATEGTAWRAHLSPDKTGTWTYTVSLTYSETGAALPGDGQTGSFEVEPSDKATPDFRARGRLYYAGNHHLRFAGDSSWFLKAGPDAPETFLAYSDFDGTVATHPKKGPLKTWEPHLRDWSEGDPTWHDGKGKGIIGALNYLSGKGLNGFSFLTYNAGGDGDNVWPFVERDAKFHYDCSKLDQWNIVFSHATARGLHLHFKLQETENDDNRRGQKDDGKPVAAALDGGELGPERKLYLREMIARFGHHLALNWNLGEENTQSTEVVREMAAFIRETDPYDHPVVIHTYPNQQDKVYRPLLGFGSELTGASLQNGYAQVHQRTLQWVQASADSGKHWVVANDEQGPAQLGVPPDAGYEGFSGKAEHNGKRYGRDEIRHLTFWGNLMAGGAGVEYYFGYQLPQNDLLCEDFRSRDGAWDDCRTALTFFHDEKIPFWAMSNANDLVGNPENENDKPWCLTNRRRTGELFLVYLPGGTEAELEVSDGHTWSRVTLDPESGSIERDEIGNVTGSIPLRAPSEGDRVVLLRRD